MKLVDLTCPGCGAQMTYHEAEKKASCEYCGKTLLVKFDSDNVSSKALSRKENGELTDEELAERRRKNLLKAQAISDGYKGLNWQEERKEFNRISQNAWRRGVEDHGDLFLDSASNGSGWESNWDWVKPVIVAILVFLYIALKLFAH